MPLKPHPVPAVLATKRVWIENPVTPGVWTLKILQRVAPGTGNVAGVPGLTLQLRARVIPLDPRTGLQRGQRNRFRDAQAAWYALGPAQKDTFRARGALRALTGRQLFTREYIASTPAVIPVIQIDLLWLIGSGNRWLLSALWPKNTAPPFYFNFS